MVVKNLLIIFVSEFHWRGEIREHIKAIPLLRLNTSKRVYNLSETLNLPLSKIYPTIADEISTSQIISLLLKSYNEHKFTYSIYDAANAYNSSKILNCRDIRHLEKRDSNPQLTYGRIGDGEDLGELRLHDGFTIDIVKHIFIKNDSKIDPNFQRTLRNFYVLLKCQGMPGIPRLYGVCLLTKAKRDISIVEKDVPDIEYIRYAALLNLKVIHRLLSAPVIMAASWILSGTAATKLRDGQYLAACIGDSIA